MADKKVILEVELIEGNANSKLNELKASLQSLDKTHKDYKPTLQLIAQAERDLVKAQQKRILVEKGLAGSTVKVEKATKKTAKEMKQLSSSTGASTSASLELGRVFSDMPYGIRGVANNIQQLASNLFFMSKKTVESTGKAVGFGGALKQLGTGLWGATGVLVAFQAGIALLDYFQVGMGKAEESLDSFRVSASGSASDLKSLLIVMREDMLSKEDLSNVIDKVNKKYKDLNLSIGEEGRLTKESIIQIDKKIASLGRLALANAMLTEIENKNAEVAKAASELQRETSDELKELGLKNIADFRDTENQRADETKEAFIERRNQLIFYQKGDYKGQLDMEKYHTASKIRRELAAFDETKKRVGTQVKELLKISTDEGFFEDFFNSKDKKGSGKAESVAKEFTDTLYREIVGFKDLIVDSDIVGEIVIPITPKITTPYDEIAEFIKQYKVLMSGLSDFIDGEFERELTIEQNKTNALNAELNNRLNNENLSKDQRASIQNEIAQNDEKLRVKQETIARKQFKVTKAFNIAMTIADTYMAAQKAYLSQMQFDPTSPIRAKIAAGVAVAAGLAKVAAIARTTFQSTAPSTPTNNGGGGGGSSARPEPSFNVVGRSGDSLLINAIQAQFGQPLKAYVVSREVTSQQQLDGIIVNQAST
tara:strand:- start:10193 stop:12151 length:1959 start_codon:yes stop_codon:yes gene_type:complete